MRHVLSATVQNVPGVLAHVAGMFASRGFNIDSLAVGETEDPHLSRMTFVVVGDDSVLEQVRKQLEKIVTVVRVDDVSSHDHVERDLMLIKVKATQGPAERDPRAVRDLPRPDRRRRPRRGDGRNRRPGKEDRSVHRPDAAVRHRRAGPHRPDRDGPQHRPHRPRGHGGLRKFAEPRRMTTRKSTGSTGCTGLHQRRIRLIPVILVASVAVKN